MRLEPTRTYETDLDNRMRRSRTCWISLTSCASTVKSPSGCKRLNNSPGWTSRRKSVRSTSKPEARCLQVEAYLLVCVARPVAPVTCHYYSSLIGPLDVDLSRTIPESAATFTTDGYHEASGPNYFKLPMVLRTGILEPREVIDLFNLYVKRLPPLQSLIAACHYV